MKLSVLITTYNSETWLEKVLVGYSNQTETDFEVVIADDGSDEKTKRIIEKFSYAYKFPIQHVWHEDHGFQKCKILNKAILASKSHYLLFTDGDCIPRNDFVATHLKHQETGFFLSGGYFKLSLDVSNKIAFKNIENQDCFSIKWLLKNGLKANFKITKLTKNKLIAHFLNWLTPTKKTFNGHNTSCFKADLIAVNGFNEDMQYGGLDRELGERLFHFGLFSKQIRYNAICVHLDHKRSYATNETWDKNFAIREYNKTHSVTIIANGIFKE
jgi:glycosyltransferase involved in cell wall biosynthesis